MQDLYKIIDFITISNWLIFLFSGLIGLMIAPLDVASGIILGGLIVSINFHLLERTLKQMFHPDRVSTKGRAVVGNVLVKYYIRFTISGALICLLIANHIVHPIGLVLGLSVVVASIFLAAMIEIKRILLFKEAV
ncbi:MAG: ATP synthase subunit I [Pseudomonadota bacterium]